MRIEHWWFTAPLRLRAILRGQRVEQELAEELQFHLDHKIEEGIAKGLSPEEARFAALRAMDVLDQRKEEMRDMRNVHWLTDFADDVRYAIRSPRCTPGATGRPAEVERSLRALGSGVTSEGKAHAGTGPWWGREVDGKADRVEEVARIHGFNNIPATPLPVVTPRAGGVLTAREGGHVRVPRRSARTVQSCGPEGRDRGARGRERSGTSVSGS